MNYILDKRTGRKHWLKEEYVTEDEKKELEKRGEKPFVFKNAGSVDSLLKSGNFIKEGDKIEVTKEVAISQINAQIEATEKARVELEAEKEAFAKEKAEFEAKQKTKK